MNVLAIDTAIGATSAAILRDDGWSAAEIIRNPRSALQQLTPAIRRLLEQASLRAGDIGLVACTVGPGSFTGVRIGVAAAKAFADAVGVPAYGVSTLKMLAAGSGSREGQLLAPVVDCCRGEVYCGAYRWFGSLDARQIAPDRSVALKDAAEWLGEAAGSAGADTGDFLLVGPGAEANAQWFGGAQVAAGPAEIDAVALARMAGDAPKSDLVDAITLQPEYLRKSQAEVRAEQKL